MKYTFIFPEFIAKRLVKINPKTPLLMGVVSITFLLIAMTVLVIYRTFTMENGLLLEGFIIFNLLCGYILLSSAILANLQQYKSLKEYEL